MDQGRRSSTLGNRASIGGGGNVRSAQHFQLDQCLSAKTMDKIIYSLQNVNEARQKSKHAQRAGAGGSAPLTYDVDGFSTYLAQSKSMATLFFWKEAEDYTALFGVEERSETAKKIFERYIKQGAEFEMTTSLEAIQMISSQLASPPEDIFEELQQTAYNTMLFELFPAFYEAVKKQDANAGATAAQSKLTDETTLEDILKANDFEIHLFAEYCREHMCEEAVTFLLECNMFALLFDPMDLESQAQRMYNLFLDPASEGRIAGVSDYSTNKIKSSLAAAGLDKNGNKTSPRDATGGAINADFFKQTQKEVLNTLNMDVWPRYKEAVLEKKSLKLEHSSRKDGDDKEGDDKKPSKANVLAAIRDPRKLEHLRKAAQKRGMREGVDFIAETEAYKMLFTEQDRKPRAVAIYNTYVAPGADMPVNIPDTMARKIERKYMDAEANVFEEATQELLQVTASNIFQDYVTEMDSAGRVEPIPENAPTKKAAAQSGGCCVLM